MPKTLDSDLDGDESKVDVTEGKDKVGTTEYGNDATRSENPQNQLGLHGKLGFRFSEDTKPHQA